MGTTRIKTSELTGIALDWAVAKCEGFMANNCPERLSAQQALAWFVGHSPNYSINWSQAGPIIEQEKISLDADNSPDWLGMTPNGKIHKTGPTPLIAAMRCYVASKLGDEVEIPEELL